MSIGKEILKKLKKDGHGAAKGRFTFYLSVDVVEEFKRKVGSKQNSPVVEELMKEFNRSVPEPKTKR